MPETREGDPNKNPKKSEQDENIPQKGRLGPQGNMGSVGQRGAKENVEEEENKE